MLLIVIATLFWSLLSVTRALSPLSSRNFTPITHLAARDLPVGTCDATTPCVNSACCGTNGLCGYSPLECGSGNCTSNCDAKAECGEYGVEGSQNCPLGVCCSKFGFCGETSDFCGTGCQAGYGGCGDVDRPSCTGGSSINKRTIGYYESWSSTRTCQSVSPAELNLNGFTHVNFAFAFFDPSTFQVTPMDSNAASLYSQFTDLKGTYNGLQTWISVGGWSFTDPGVTRNAFSNMAASETNTQTFINGLIKFMDTYGFDGIDLDWEYPAADDRGGVPADFTNYVSLVKAIRLAFGTKYGFSITLPTSYWYLQHFDLANIQDSVDWFNFMAYDLHGTWDAQSIYVGPYIAPHTNITEIDAGLDLLWRAGVTPAKVTMGLAWYGRSFTLIDPTCNTPNGVCKFSGGANAGPCSNASGILDYQEIQDIISTNSLTPVHDTTAAVKWITWDSNQWISYDDSDTFTEKRAFANSRCLGGTMVWAIDQMDQTQSNGMGVAPGVTVAQQSSADQASADQLAQTVCYTSDCGAGCKSGTTEVSEMNGQPGSVSTTERCDSGVYESLCCANGGTMGKCLWRGYRGAGLSCIGGCAAGETEIARNTNYHDDSGDYTCTGGQLSYCCSGFKAASAKSTLASDAENAAEQVAEAAAEQAALDLAAKAFCRVAVPALLAPLELLEDLIPIFGEIADIAELAATPALINLCTDEIEKSGSAEFKVFGKEKSLSFDKPTETAADRPASSSHESATTKESSSCSVAEKVKRADLRALSQTTTYTSYTTSDVLKTCTFGKYPQACGHYSSVINRWPAFSTIACTWKEITDIRPAPDIWTGQHNKYWSLGWMQEDDVDCQGDEFPPAVVWQARDNKQWIRQLPQSQNGPAGALFANVCPETPKSSTISSKYKSSVVIGCRTTSHYSLTEVITWPALVLKFSGDGGFGVGDEYGLSANPCWPSSLIDDPGWALMTNDAWYDDHPASKAVIAGGLYAFSPPASYTSGKINRPDWNKRGLDLDDLDPEGIIFVDANSTRKATDEELREQFGFQRCADDDCSMEKEALGIESAPVRGIGKIMPATTTVSTTTHLPAPSLTSNPDSRATGPALPLITGMPKRFPTKSKDQIQKELRELLDMVAS